jgi:DNA-binding NarL/FixJ family response regulator
MRLVTPESRIDAWAEGEAALAQGDWAGARASFEAILAETPEEPRALDGLSIALSMLPDTSAARETRERAYVAHRQRGDARGAAAAAIFVALGYRIWQANDAAAEGWLARAERCLDGIGPCSERGALEVERAKRTREPAVAESHARRALELARELGDPDLEIAALAQVGVALVRSGQWEDGMALLDEAMAVAMGGEATGTVVICDTCCQTLVACEQIADLRRATEWCRVVVDFSDRRRFTPMHGWCRAIYAGVLASTGEWERAERELLDSLRWYDQGLRGMGDRVIPLARLAELRLRQGRPEEAARLLEGYEEQPQALVPVVRLRLLHGQLGASADLIERRLDALGPDVPEVAALLELLVDVRLAEGALDAAEEAAGRLDELATALRRDNLRALSLLAAARVERARGDEGAVSKLEAAAELFMLLDMPFEEGVACLDLAQAFAGDRPGLAVEEARRSLALFERLGAARKANEAAALLRSFGASGRTAVRAETLTRREREVLALLAEGLTNAEIAARLVISDKTAGHHVSHILRKLGLRNRAEAAAYALRQAAGPASEAP